MESVWVHNISPFAIQFSESFGFRWYGLAYLSGFVTGFLFVRYLYRKGRTQFTSEEQILDYLIWLAAGVMIGGRVGFAIFYEPSLFVSFGNQFPYWGLLRIDKGGMSSHGGILGVMLVCYLFARRRGMSMLHVLDLTVIGSSLGFFFGRLANFVNGELYGRAAEAGTRWAVKFPAEMQAWIQREVNLEKLAELAPAVEKLGSVKTSRGESLALSTETWRSWIEGYVTNAHEEHRKVYWVVEGLMEAVQKGNVAVTEALAPVLTARHPSQIYQALLEGLLVFLVLAWVWRKPRKPGVIAYLFGLLYCIARVIGEQYRMPDAAIGFDLFGLTRGQWISLGMILTAAVLLYRAARADRAKLGGWMS